MSSRLPNEPRWVNARFGIWICATIWSLSCLLLAEWKTRMISLRNTQLCERLALFAIVILGDGFSQVGEKDDGERVRLDKSKGPVCSIALPHCGLL
jgi:low temperature requirement protein LtrA